MDTIITRYSQVVMAPPERKVSAVSLGTYCRFKYATFRDLWKYTTDKTLTRVNDELLERDLF